MLDFAKAMLPLVKDFGGWFVLSIILLIAYYYSFMRERRGTSERSKTLVEIIEQNAKSNGDLAMALNGVNNCLNGIANSIQDIEHSRERDTDKLLEGITLLQQRVQEAEVQRARELVQILEVMKR